MQVKHKFKKRSKARCCRGIADVFPSLASPLVDLQLPSTLDDCSWSCIAEKGASEEELAKHKTKPIEMKKGFLMASRRRRAGSGNDQPSSAPRRSKGGAPEVEHRGRIASRQGEADASSKEMGGVVEEEVKDGRRANHNIDKDQFIMGNGDHQCSKQAEVTDDTMGSEQVERLGELNHGAADNEEEDEEDYDDEEEDDDDDDEEEEEEDEDEEYDEEEEIEVEDADDDENQVATAVESDGEDDEEENKPGKAPRRQVLSRILSGTSNMIDRGTNNLTNITSWNRRGGQQQQQPQQNGTTDDQQHDSPSRTHGRNNSGGSSSLPGGDFAGGFHLQQQLQQHPPNEVTTPEREQQHSPQPSQQQGGKNNLFARIPQLRNSPRRSVRLVPKEMENHFSCSICLTYYEAPVVTACGHIFCKQCLMQHLNHGLTAQQHNNNNGATCPLCRAVLPQDGKFEPSTRTLEEMSKYFTDCTNHGCKAVMPLSHAKAHQRECEWVVQPCLHAQAGCEWRSLKRDMQAHLEVCPYHAIRKFYPRVYSRLDHVHQVAHRLEGHIQRHDTIIRHQQRVIMDLQQLRIQSIEDNVSVMNLLMLWPEKFWITGSWYRYPFHHLVGILYILPFCILGVAVSTGRLHQIHQPEQLFRVRVNMTLEETWSKFLAYRNVSSSMLDQGINNDSLFGDGMRIGACWTEDPNSWLCLHVPCILILIVVLWLAEILLIEAHYTTKQPLFMKFNNNGNHGNNLPSAAGTTGVAVSSPSAASQQQEQEQAPQQAPPAAGGPEGNRVTIRFRVNATQPQAISNNGRQNENNQDAGSSAQASDHQQAIDTTRADSPTNGSSSTSHQHQQQNHHHQQQLSDWRIVFRGPITKWFVPGEWLMLVSVAIIVAQANMWFQVVTWLSLLLPLSLSDSVVESKFKKPVCKGFYLGVTCAWMDGWGITTAVLILVALSQESQHVRSILVFLMGTISQLCLPQIILNLVLGYIFNKTSFHSIVERNLTEKHSRFESRFIYFLSSSAILALMFKTLVLVVASQIKVN